MTINYWILGAYIFLISAKLLDMATTYLLFKTECGVELNPLIGNSRYKYANMIILNIIVLEIVTIVLLNSVEGFLLLAGYFGGASMSAAAMNCKQLSELYKQKDVPLFGSEAELKNQHVCEKIYDCETSDIHCRMSSVLHKEKSRMKGMKNGNKSA